MVCTIQNKAFTCFLVYPTTEQVSGVCFPFDGNLKAGNSKEVLHLARETLELPKGDGMLDKETDAPYELHAGEGFEPLLLVNQGQQLFLLLKESTRLMELWCVR